jgi:hypothetical protein
MFHGSRRLLEDDVGLADEPKETAKESIADFSFMASLS